MLAKKCRLKKKKDFDLVFKEGRSAYGKMLGVKIAQGQSENNRFGIILGTKVSKLAVVRNLFKRRIRNIIFQENTQLDQGHDCVIITFPAIKNASYSIIDSELTSLFRKLKFYKKS
jgi:ribonuclease P protein component